MFRRDFQKSEIKIEKRARKTPETASTKLSFRRSDSDRLNSLNGILHDRRSRNNRMIGFVSFYISVVFGHDLSSIIRRNEEGKLSQLLKLANCQAFKNSSLYGVN